MAILCHLRRHRFIIFTFHFRFNGRRYRGLAGNPVKLGTNKKINNPVKLGKTKRMLFVLGLLGFYWVLLGFT